MGELGFNRRDLAPLPSRESVALRERDEKMFAAYQAGMTLAELAELLELPTPQAARVALNRALARLDQRMRKSVDSARARELLELNRIGTRLEDAVNPDRGLDAKTASELRLLSESRRRLYAIDLKEEKDGGPETIVVDVRFPWERQAEVVDGEAEEITPPPEIEAGEKVDDDG